MEETLKQRNAINFCSAYPAVYKHTILVYSHAERVMSILNLGLQSIGVARSKMNAGQ